MAGIRVFVKDILKFGSRNFRFFIKLIDILNYLLAYRTASPAGEQTGLADSMVVLARESDRGKVIIPM